MDSPNSASPPSLHAKHEKRVLGERVLRRVQAKRSLVTLRSFDEATTSRKSRFVEDQSVGGIVATSASNEQVPAPSRLSRFVNTINPFNALRAFSKTYRDVKDDLTVQNLEHSHHTGDCNPTQFNSTTHLSGTVTSIFNESLEESRKTSASLRGRSLSSLRKARSEVNLLPRGRISTPSLSPAKRYSSESVRRSSSRDTRKQRKLSKRVSDLEAQLDKARRELQEALNPTSPGSELSSHYEKYTPRFKIHNSRRTPFTPGLLPTLPSESLLYPEMGFSQPASSQPVTPDERLLISLDGQLQSQENEGGFFDARFHSQPLAVIADDSDDERRNRGANEQFEVMDITEDDPGVNHPDRPSNPVYQHENAPITPIQDYEQDLNVEPVKIPEEPTAERVDSQQSLRVLHTEPIEATDPREAECSTASVNLQAIGGAAQPEEAAALQARYSELPASENEAGLLTTTSSEGLHTQATMVEKQRIAPAPKDAVKAFVIKAKRKTTKTKKRKSSNDDNGTYKPGADDDFSDDDDDDGSRVKKRRKSTGSAKKRPSTAKAAAAVTTTASPSEPPLPPPEPPRPRRSTDTQRAALEIIEEETDSNFRSSSSPPPPRVPDDAAQPRRAKDTRSPAEIMDSVALADDEPSVGMGGPPTAGEARSTPPAGGDGRRKRRPSWDWPDFVF